MELKLTEQKYIKIEKNRSSKYPFVCKVFENDKCVDQKLCVSRADAEKTKKEYESGKSLKESNAPFWLIGLSKNRYMPGSDYNRPCYYKSRKKQTEIAKSMIDTKVHPSDEVYLLSGIVWDNMLGSWDNKQMIAYIKGKGKLILSKNDLEKTEGDIPKGVPKDGSLPKSYRTYTSVATKLELKDPGNKILIDQLSNCKNKSELVNIIGDVKSTDKKLFDKLKNKYLELNRNKDLSFSDLIKEITDMLELKITEESTNNPKKVTEAKVVQPVGLPQTSDSFVNIDVDLDNNEVSELIIRLSQAIRSEQKSIIEYVALRSANAITNEARTVIDQILEEEKNHMVALTSLLYKEILGNHSANVDKANDEFTLPKLTQEHVIDKDNKLTESLDQILSKVEETSEPIDEATKMSDDYMLNGEKIHGLGQTLDKLQKLLPSTGEEINVKNITFGREGVMTRQADTDIYEVEVDVSYDADFQARVASNLTDAIPKINPDIDARVGFIIVPKSSVLGSKLRFKVQMPKDSDIIIDEGRINDVCKLWFDKASTYEAFIELA